MSIELRPLGVACNLACHYCYQNPQRDAGNQRMTYDLDKMKREATRIGGPFTLFGGEPLLMRFQDLEDLFAWGLATSGSNAIQTNGVLIEDRHIDLFRRYKVAVGISIDGPDELNDARWHRGLEKTRQSTAIVESVIERLCREYQPPGLIITLHRGNASAEKLPVMAQWMVKLHSIGVRSVRLHLLEVDHGSVRDSLALSPRENIQALLAFADVRKQIAGMQLDLFEEMEALLEGRDSKVGCTWRACDPYTTEAVQGVEGNGQSSNCGRTNKEGIGFIKASKPGFERYVSLYRTPQSENGCAGCRFFLMCKGQCPGTSVDGDWRNRTEHCEEWKHLFTVIERRMIQAGKIPLTIQPVRFEVEQRQLESWQNGHNPSISRTLSDVYRQQAPSSSSEGSKLEARITWVGEPAREQWESRLEEIRTMLEDRTAHVAGVRMVPAASFHRLTTIATAHGLSTAIFPAEALPTGICTRPAETARGVFLTGSPIAIAAAKAAWEKRDLSRFYALLNLPACCLCHVHRTSTETLHLPESLPVHPLLSPLGIAALPIEPCRFDCPSALVASVQWIKLAAADGYDVQVSWLKECFSWAISWSELHGITEVKTPLFKMCFLTGANPRASLIRRAGISKVDGSVPGLTFPYAPVPQHSRMIEIGQSL